MATVVLKDVRGSFLRLFEKTASTEGGRAKYRGNWIIDPSDPFGKENIKKCSAAIEEVAQAVFKDHWEDILDDIDVKRLDFRKGDTFKNGMTREIYDGYEGNWIVKTSNDRRPQLLYRDKSDVPVDDIENVFRSGWRYDVVVNFYGIPPTDKKRGGAGIFSSIELVRYRREDEEFSGGGVSRDLLDDLDDFDDEEVEPKKSRRRSRDDDEDERPRKSRRRRDYDEDDDDDEDERPRKSRRRRDYDEDDDDDLDY